MVVDEPCTIAYDVSWYDWRYQRIHTKVLHTRRMARKFSAQTPDSSITVVKVCDGKIAKWGKHTFKGRK